MLKDAGCDGEVMAHVVCGYPSFEDNMQELEIMAEAGVDLVELQFPFSEPSADGPLFVKANEQSLKSGTTVDQCFEFMAEASAKLSFKILIMGSIPALSERACKLADSSIGRSGRM